MDATMRGILYHYTLNEMNLFLSMLLNHKGWSGNNKSHEYFNEIPLNFISLVISARFEWDKPGENIHIIGSFYYW